MALPEKLIELMNGHGEWHDRSWFPPGPKLALCLSGDKDTLSALSDTELLEVAAAARRQTSWAQARELAAIAELHHRRTQPLNEDGDGDTEDFRVVSALESVTEEVAASLRITGNAAATLVHLADRLSRDLPGTRRYLETGEIDLPKARVICDLTDQLGDGIPTQVENKVLPAAPRQTTGQLRRRVKRIVERIAPAERQERTRDTVAKRRLEIWETPAGTSDLALLDLDPVQARGIYNKITAVASGLKTEGDTRRLDQIRADLATTLLRGTDLPDAARARLHQGDLDINAEGAAPSADGHARPAAAGPTPTGNKGNGSAPLAHGDGQQDHTSIVHLAEHADDRPSSSQDAPHAEASPQPDHTATHPQAGQRPGQDSAKASSAHDQVQHDHIAAHQQVGGQASSGLDGGRASPDVDQTQHSHTATGQDVGTAQKAGPVGQVTQADDGDGMHAARWQAPPCHPNTDRQSECAADDQHLADLAQMIDRRLRQVLNYARGAGRLNLLHVMICQAVQELRAELDEHHPCRDAINEGAHGRPGYRPSAALRQMIEERHATCAFPSCNQPVRRCDLDHTIPWPRGATCHCNLEALCRRHHRVKQTPGWRLFQPWPGLLIWITPSGNWHISLPERH